MSQFEAAAIGARIALARREAGLTQEQLAELSSFSKRSLQDYETGVTIPYKHLREIGALLKKPVDWFLHGDPDEISEDRLSSLEDRIDESNHRLRRVEDLLREMREEPPQRPEETE